MGIGQRKVIELVYVSNAKSAEGNNVQQPKEFYTRWAEVSDASGFREYLQGQTQMGERKKFLIRFDFDLFPGADWKVKYLGKEYTITEVTRVQEKKFYWLMRGIAK